MSRADEIFAQNMTDIMENGFWDTELDVRPKWEDGTPAHTVKKFGIVNRYNLQEEFPILTIRRTAFKSVSQNPFSIMSVIFCAKISSALLIPFHLIRIHFYIEGIIPQIGFFVKDFKADFRFCKTPVLFSQKNKSFFDYFGEKVDKFQKMGYYINVRKNYY